MSVISKRITSPNGVFILRRHIDTNLNRLVIIEKVCIFFASTPLKSNLEQGKRIHSAITDILPQYNLTTHPGGTI